MRGYSDPAVALGADRAIKRLSVGGEALMVTMDFGDQLLLFAGANFYFVSFNRLLINWDASCVFALSVHSFQSLEPIGGKSE